MRNYEDMAALTPASVHATQLAVALGGRYRHVRELGRGAIGRVVLVEDAIEGGARAAKIVPTEHGERLRWELSLLTSLAHPNLAAVHELLRVDAALPDPFGLEPGTWVLIEELASGSASDVAARALPDVAARVRFATSVGSACARALAAIHGAGLVHGDVKPSNVVVPEPPADPATARLVDLGLAGVAGAGPVAGTPGYLAPEAWLGERTAASDLFALGVTLHRWISPEPGDGAGSSRSDLAAGARPPRAADLPEAVPASLRALIDELLRERAEERPSSAREVARRLGAGGGDASAWLDQPSADERARRVGVLPLEGRSRETRALREALATPGVVLVHGPPGAGRTRTIREAVRAVQTDRALRGETVPTWIAGALPARATHASIVHDESGAISPARARAAVRAAELDGVALVIVLERDDAENGGADARRVAIGPLDDDAAAALLAAALGLRAASTALQRAARAACSGLPGRLCRLIAGALAEGRDPSRPDLMRSLGREESTALALPEPARALAEALAVAGGALRAEEARSIAGGGELGRLSALLASSGLATWGPGGLALRPDRVRRIDAELSDTRRRAIARALERDVRGGIARACVDAALGRQAEAIAGVVAAAAGARAAGDPLGAADLLRLGRERVARARADRAPIVRDERAGGGTPEDAIAIALADALRAAGEERSALGALEGVAARGALALRADLSRTAGDTADAEALAASLSGDGGASPDEAALAARCVLARLAWGRGDLERATALAESVRADAADHRALAARALEIDALVALTRGDAPGAASAAAELERVAATIAGHAGTAAQARAASVAGSAALIGGAIDRALASYERAAELAERAGERHAAASATVNLGLARLDAGRLGPAIAALRAGAHALTALARPRELGRALFNLANAAFLAGDDALAQLAAERARDAAREVGDADAAAHAAMVLGDLAMRAGHVRAAIRALREIDASPAARPAIEARTAIAHASLGELEPARAHVAAARAGAAEGTPHDAEVAIAEARVALAAGDASLGEVLSVRAMAAARTFETRVRSALVAADAAELSGRRGEASIRLALARALLDGAAAGLDPGARARLRAVPAYQRALAARPDAAAGAVPAREGRAVIALARRVAAEHRPGRVVEALAAAALELAGAERAFVIARGDDGTMMVRCARGLGGPLGPEHRPSRSIAARVIDERRPLVSVDALEDARWGGAASVHAMALRSVLAVPLAARDGATLALYVDDRLRPAAFDDATVADLAALAELGAAALAGAERWRDERRDARLRARRQRLLERELDERGEELRSLRAPAGGGPFETMIAQSEAMRRVLTLAARVAASGISVLIVGESGTGKELLARAIHAAGTRRDRAFVAESCAAIPEGLLESTLFGHVRGAFTGADRSRRGLFEIAHGGTLFLDEVGETSAAMQAKLLRALQEGEIRSVGSERTRRVDVRVIAATRRDLAAMAREGAFREDLYYRLAVVTIELPPLRERLEDVAPLAAALVARHSPDRRVRIEPRALEALRRHPWPGNVRELENELRRALLVAGDAITLEHLSPALRGESATDEGASRGGELDLKSQTESLERRLVTRALAVCGGNQTRAARALGLSRFGLQKMIKRLGLEPR